MTVEFRGRLRALSLSDILQLLSFSSQTGTLHLEQGWNARTITFEKGRLTYLTAATRLPSVLELLIRARRITPAQLQQATTEATLRAGEVTASALLLEQGTITQADLDRCRDQLLEETIYSLFLWRNCEFFFDSDEIVREGGLAVDLSAERLIMDGTRRVDEWIDISPVVPSVHMIFRKRGTGDWGMETDGGGGEKAKRGEGESDVFGQGLATAPSSPPLPPVSAGERLVLEHVDGQSDVVALARASALTQFETARRLYRLVQAGVVEAVPPDKVRIIELFTFLVESIYVKLTLYGYARVAFEFENQLNQFAQDNGLKVRMRGGKVRLSDLDLPIESTALIDLYKLFIAIEQNKFTKMFEPEIVHGLVEGLYLHLDPEAQTMLRLYEFYAIEGLLE